MLTIALRIAFGFTVLAVVLLAVRLRRMHRRIADLAETVDLLEETNQAVDLINAALHRAGDRGRHLHRIKGLVWLPVGWLANQARSHPLWAKAAAATASGSFVFAGMTELPNRLPSGQPPMPPVEAPIESPALPTDTPPVPPVVSSTSTTSTPRGATSSQVTASKHPHVADAPTEPIVDEPVPMAATTTTPPLLELSPTTVTLPPTTLPTIPPVTTTVTGPDCELVDVDLLDVEACI